MTTIERIVRLKEAIRLIREAGEGTHLSGMSFVMGIEDWVALLQKKLWEGN